MGNSKGLIYNAPNHLRNLVVYSPWILLSSEATASCNPISFKHCRRVFQETFTDSERIHTLIISKKQSRSFSLLFFMSSRNFPSSSPTSSSSPISYHLSLAYGLTYLFMSFSLGFASALDYYNLLCYPY